MRKLFLCVIGFWLVAAQAAESGQGMQGEKITLQTSIGTYLEGYVAGPEDAELGILILHDRWGLNQTVRDWVHRFADRGYRALAIDVFDGRISDEHWLATEIMQATDPEWVKVDVQAGLDYLARQGRKLATLGAGFGGWQAFQAVIGAPERVDATVVIYGLLEADVEQVRALNAPVMTVYARDDEQITPAQREADRLLLKKSLITHRAYAFPGGHGYMDPMHSAYDPQATQDTWTQVDEFLRSFIEG